MNSMDPHLVRHLLLRLSLGAILVWFGTQQVINPGAWTGFVPGFVASHSPIGGTGLIMLHGSLLLLSAIGISFGAFPRSAALLAAALLVEIIVVLILKGQSEGLIARDVGLLVMAVVLMFDQFPILGARSAQPSQGDAQSGQRPLSLSM